MRPPLLRLTTLGFMLLSGAHAAPDFSAEQIAFFEKEVQPILQTNCVKCHGGTNERGDVKIRSGFQLISRRGIVKGGGLGSAYNEAEPSESVLLHMISYKDDEHEMPPSGKLADADIATLTRWVEMGMPWTPGEADKLIEVEEDNHQITTINDYTKSYWSYKPLKRPEIPKVSASEWQAHPIDAFVMAKLEEAGLQANPQAAPRALIRRAYHNLTGLPPTPEEMRNEVEAFSETSWQALIERLLDSPHYGEKWARHWLDIVRYAESNGFERDSVKEFIWRYRDYVIDAFNHDKPYDQFIREQLAGDELDEVTAESLIATGYHRLMQWDDEPADPLQHRYDVLDDNVRVTTEGFLAMTMGCARCHDHKGDPISQEDYYNFMSFFSNVTPMDKQKVVQHIDISLPKEERLRRERDLDEREQSLIRQIMVLEESAKQKLAKQFPDIDLTGTTTSSPTLIAPSQEHPQTWAYTSTQPPREWSTVGFRPSDWQIGKAPFGQTGDAKTRWNTPQMWMQKTFGLTQIPTRLTLSIRHHGDVEVYLNGQLIFASERPAKDYREIVLDKSALTAIQTGRNVVAVTCKHPKGRERFLDLGMRADFAGKAFAKLLRQHRDQAFTEIENRNYRDFNRQLEKVREQRQQSGIRAMMVQETGSDPKPMFVHLRGSAHAEGDEVEPAFPAIFAPPSPSISDASEGKTTGRRRALADWIASKDNPRTARVMVNRIWQHHFGRGLCPTPSDFGFLGEKATHPDLLDWLAAEFMARDWSIKEMHRLIMSSKTYQLSSHGQEAALAQDPQNNLFWRVEMRRLAAEELRDTMLGVAGALNPKQGGPSFYPTLPPEVLATSSTGAGKWGKSSPEEQRRRSVYISIKRSLKPTFLTDFDFADTDAPCSARFTTTVPTQALAMLNSKEVNDHAKRLAERLKKEVDGTVRDKVVRGLQLVTTREPRPAEVTRVMEMITILREEHQLSDDEALERFCLLALNLNEFIYLD